MTVETSKATILGEQLREKLWKEIGNTRDSHRRQELIGRYGTRRYWVESGAKPIHQDEFGTLYRYTRNENYSCRRVDCCFQYYVCVTNATAEPDGSFVEYFVQVPPYMVSAREAVAWTFGMAARDYHPTAES